MKKLILIALAISFTFSSCEEYKDGWNVDEKKPSAIPASYLVTSSQQILFRRMTSTSVNYNIFKLFAQHWNETTYTDESNYDIRGRDIGGNLSLYLYRDVLNDLQDATKLINEDEMLSDLERSSQLGVIEMLSVFTWHILVDTYGDVPYTEALQGGDNLIPVYDNDEDIYANLITRLNAGLVMLSAGGDSFGSDDLIYSGSTAKWVEFGNSLKLKLALRISDYDNAQASTMASEAASNVLSSSESNFAFPFESGTEYPNPIWSSLVQSGRNDFVVANTFVDLIVPLNDPRTSVFMKDNVVPYLGGTYGEGSSFTATTQIGEIFHTEDLEGILMSYSEVQFMLAEAVERGFITGDAEMYYNAGVSASIIYWGGSQADADTYLAQASVAYTTAGSTWKEVIGNQKYISLFSRGFESWSSWRSLDYPNTMSRPPISGEAVPRRYLYGNSDANLNEANYDAASAAMGGDEKDSRVFWDINGVGN